MGKSFNIYAIKTSSKGSKRQPFANARIAFSFLLLLIFIVATGYSYAGEHCAVDTKKAVIHHTASPDVSSQTIDQWHRERGWEGIGYHFVIRRDGSVEKGRRLCKLGAHALGRNNQVGIVLTGYDQFTSQQRSALVKLLNKLEVQSIERHHEKCPGIGLKWVKLNNGKWE